MPTSDEDVPQAWACSGAVSALAPLSGPPAASYCSFCLIPCLLHPPSDTLASLPRFLLGFCRAESFLSSFLSLLVPTVSAGSSPSWALTTAVTAEHQLQIPQSNKTAVFWELNPEHPNLKASEFTISGEDWGPNLLCRRICRVYGSENWIEQLCSMAQLRVWKIELGCHEEASLQKNLRGKTGSVCSFALARLTVVLDAALQRGGKALRDGPLQARWGWWPWSPAMGLVLGNLFSPKHSALLPTSGAALTPPSGAS